MAVVENVVVDLGMNGASSLANGSLGDELETERYEGTGGDDPVVADDQDLATAKHLSLLRVPDHLINGQQRPTQALGSHRVPTIKAEVVLKNGMQSLQHEAMVGAHLLRSNDHELHGNGDISDHDGFKRDMRELVDLLSKLNPMAEEFVPGSGGAMANIMLQNGGGNGNQRRKRVSSNQVKRKMNSRTNMAQREEVIRRTVYVSDIDQQVTEEQLAALFSHCGHVRLMQPLSLPSSHDRVVDCRICGDPNSVLHFAFIEFFDEEGAKAALNLAGTVLGFYPVKVLRSKTAIAPVNPTFLPRSEDEREMCARTIYCTHIDKKVSQQEVKLFFETLCGEVYRLRLLGDHHHSTRIAFVEFAHAESAITALNCSGAVLGCLPIRVSPSKTPVRPRAPRSPVH